MRKIIVELTQCELTELYEAIIARQVELTNHLERISKHNNLEKIALALQNRINDLDNVHSKIANSEKNNNIN